MTAANSQYRRATLVEGSRFVHSEAVAQVDTVQAEFESHGGQGPDEDRRKHAKKLGGPGLDLVPLQPRPVASSSTWIWHRHKWSLVHQ